MINLENHFVSEAQWVEFAQNFTSGWRDSDDEKQLLQICGKRKDIAQVIFFHVGAKSMKWMHSKIPALDHLTPAECLQDELLIRRLKVCLMRFPS